MGEAGRHESADVLARARVVVTGRVQGVFFRHSCAREAASAGLAGWVQNRFDGAVEAVFQGDRTAVEQLLEWCHKGPPAARVADVQVEWEAPVSDEQPFQVTWG